MVEFCPVEDELGEDELEQLLAPTTATRTVAIPTLLGTPRMASS
jgi:hypothetical protein